MACSPSLLSVPSSSWPTIHAPPPSQDNSMQEVLMPNVFVIPPEEEHDENPPWCYFNAAEAVQEVHATRPDIDALDTALNLQQQVDNRAPAFHRALQNVSQETVVLPKRGSAAQLKENVGAGKKEGGSRNRVLDEEIVEVIKVRRNEGREDAGYTKNYGMKKSKTFRARATDAFRSIKNVGKGDRRPIPSMSGGSSGSGENARQSADCRVRDIPVGSSAPNLSRRRSLVLSQLFTFSQSNRPHAADPDTPLTPTSPFPDPLPHRHNMQTMPAMASPSRSHARRLHPSPSFEDCMNPLSNPASETVPPNPPLSKRKSFRKRISVLELQRLFAASPSSPPAAPTDPKTPAVVMDVFSTSISDPYSLGSSELASSTSSSSSSYLYISAGCAPAEQDEHESDRESVEMRLDSLHFDSLHFDPDEFL